MLIYFFIKYNYIKLIASDKKTDFYFLWLINMMKFSLSWIYYLLSDYNFEGINQNKKNLLLELLWNYLI